MRGCDTHYVTPSPSTPEPRELPESGTPTRVSSRLCACDAQMRANLIHAKPRCSHVCHQVWVKTRHQHRPVRIAIDDVTGVPDAECLLPDRNAHHHRPRHWPRHRRAWSQRRRALEFRLHPLQGRGGPRQLETLAQPYPYP
eukprot:scaffold86665_cov55-Phaeocystis_antarctica.AAC.2